MGLYSVAFGQQHALYSNYIFNLHMVNPAYTGARDALSVNMSYRSQWVGFEGAPQTQNLSVHSPITKRNMSLGLQVQNDVIGPRQSTSAAFSYAYKIKLKAKEYLSFGLQGGMINAHYDASRLEYAQNGDPHSYTYAGNQLAANFDFGVMYLSKRSYIGFSAMSLNGAKINESDLSDARLDPVLNLMAGKIFALSESVSLKPSALIRKGVEGPVQFDANMGMLINNSLWLTASYRYQFGMVFSTHYLIREHLHIGYAYDWALNGLMAKQAGTHEIYLSCDFNVYRSKTRTPRYF
jgi:type IX secretion system PorP/SprF family membrane protein